MAVLAKELFFVDLALFEEAGGFKKARANNRFPSSTHGQGADALLPIKNALEPEVRRWCDGCSRAPYGGRRSLTLGSSDF